MRGNWNEKVLRFLNAKGGAPVLRYFLQYRASCFFLTVEPWLLPRTETIAKRFEKNVHYGGVFPEFQIHFPVSISIVKITSCYYAPWLGFFFFNDFS